MKFIERTPGWSLEAFKVCRAESQSVYSNKSGRNNSIHEEWLKIDREIATATYDSLAKFFNEDGVYLRTAFGC
jgi:hypothetical protein